MSRRHTLRLSHRYAGWFAAQWDSFVGIFGEKFREERERRGFTLDDISNVTKINSRMLQAIEQEQFDVLPGGVFNKGFIRATAKVLGFNPEDAITGYLSALRQAQLDPQALAVDQPLPPRTTAGAIKQAMPTVPVADASRVVEKTAPPASLKWTTIKPVASPIISQPSASIPSPREESPQPSPTLQVSAKPESSAPLPPVAPDIIRPATTQPPPLWIPPSPVSPPPISRPSASKMSDSPTPAEASRAPSPSHAPPSIPREEAQHPQAAPIQQPSLRILIDEPAAEPRPPNNALPEPQKKYAAAAGVLAAQKAGAASWKIPALILAFAAIVIVALLANRSPRHVTVQSAEPAQSNSAPAPQTSPATNAAKQTLPSPAAAPAPTDPAKSRAIASAVNPSPLPAAALPAPNHRPAKAVAPPPFRVGISAVENCSISITADGELVARENLIAPANTSVRASHEIVVQVSNPAAISFRWNDRSVAPQGTEAQGAKTFVFDNNGLRTGQ